MKLVSEYLALMLRDMQADGLVEAVEASPDTYTGAWFAAHAHTCDRAILHIVQKAASAAYGPRKGGIPRILAACEYYLHVGGFHDSEINRKLMDSLRPRTKRLVTFLGVVRGTEYDSPEFRERVSTPVFNLVKSKESPRSRALAYAKEIDGTLPEVARRLRELML
jgi:hypothetical protein